MADDRQQLLDQIAVLRDEADRHRQFAGWLAFFIIAATFASTALMVLTFTRLGAEPSAFMASLATNVIQSTFWLSGIAAFDIFKNARNSTAQPGSAIYSGPERRVVPGSKTDKESLP